MTRDLDPVERTIERTIADLRTALASFPDDRLVRILRAAEAERSHAQAIEMENLERLQREQVKAVRWRGEQRVRRGGWR